MLATWVKTQNKKQLYERIEEVPEKLMIFLARFNTNDIEAGLH